MKRLLELDTDLLEPEAQAAVDEVCAYLGMHSTAEDNGMQLLGQLERAGLTIVRSGEAAK